MITYLISYLSENIRVAQERLRYDIIHDIFLYDIMYDFRSYLILYMIFIYDIIQDILMSTLTFHALQQPILPRHSVLMQQMTVMILTDMADQWISIRSVTLLIKALLQIWIWRKTPRCSHHC
jgi:hypothetical protein